MSPSYLKKLLIFLNISILLPVSLFACQCVYFSAISLANALVPMDNVALFLFKSRML